MTRSLLRGALAAALALGLSACGAVQQDAVTAVAAQFHQAYRGGDGATACAALAPATRSDLAASAGRPCAEALLAEDLPEVGAPVRVEVFGTMAMVGYPAGTTFLARFRGGWKVMAAGCRPASEHRYDCPVQGG